jgi:hypothetical protein
VWPFPKPIKILDEHLRFAACVGGFLQRESRVKQRPGLHDTGSKQRRGKAGGERAGSLDKRGGESLHAAGYEKDGRKTQPGTYRPILKTFLIIPLCGSCCVIEDRRKKPKLLHFRNAFIFSWNCSRLRAEVGSLRKLAHRSSNLFFVSSETSKLSKSGAAETHSSSTNCSFSCAERA